MNLILRTFLTLTLLTICVLKAEGKTSTPLPISYPSDTIGNSRPYIIWQDLYNKRDKKIKARYRLSIKSDNDNLKPITFFPELYYKSYYVFKTPINLTDNKYSYSIERIIDNKSINSRRFYYDKYPVINEFEINNKEDTDLDSLPPEYLIQYLYLDKNNRYTNGYNILFYGSSSIITLGIGILFTSVFDFGIVSTIISVISFTSSAIGISATGYYGYKYLNKKSEMQKILEIGKGVTINGKVSQDNIYADIELTF